jgi:hypothetical protein
MPEKHLLENHSATLDLITGILTTASATNGLITVELKPEQREQLIALKAERGKLLDLAFPKPQPKPLKNLVATKLYGQRVFIDENGSGYFFDAAGTKPVDLTKLAAKSQQTPDI